MRPRRASPASGPPHNVACDAHGGVRRSRSVAGDAHGGVRRSRSVAGDTHSAVRRSRSVAGDTHSAVRRSRSVACDTQSAVRRSRSVAGDTRAGDHCVGYIVMPVIHPARTCTESTLAGRSMPSGVAVTRTLVAAGTLRMNTSPD